MYQRHNKKGKGGGGKKIYILSYSEKKEKGLLGEEFFFSADEKGEVLRECKRASKGGNKEAARVDYILLRQKERRSRPFERKDIPTRASRRKAFSKKQRFRREGKKAGLEETKKA